MNLITKELIKNKDLAYKEFSSKLIPTIKKENIIGVKTPIIRKLEKSFSVEEKKKFLSQLPHKYLEENTMHGIILENITKDINEIFEYLDTFLPYVDNWATCDTLSFKIFKKYKKEVFIKIQKWIKSEKEYVVRFGIDMLIHYFIDPEYVEKANKLLSRIKRKEYYINMSIAWYYSFALIKEYNKTITYFENHMLDEFVHNKSLQKAIESYRISEKAKEYLKSLKYKKNTKNNK